MGAPSSGVADILNILRDTTDSSIFLDEQILENVFESHGIDHTGSLDEAQQCLIKHLVLGHCVENAENNSNGACKAIAQGFSTPSELGVLILGRLVVASPTAFSSARMYKICQALGMQGYLSRKRALKYLNDYRERIASYEQVQQSSIRQFFSGYERLKKQELVDLFLLHHVDLELPDQLNKERLKQILIEHIGHGCCLNNGGLTPSGCAATIQEFQDAEGYSPQHKKELQIFILSNVLPQISTSPLK